MIDVYTDVLQFRGNHYDFGVFQGELLKKSPLLANRHKQWFSRQSHRFHIDVEQFERIVLSFAPLMWEEIIGLKDSLEFSLENAIRYFGGYYLEYVRSGCSIFTKDYYIVRNYDNDPLSYEGRLVLFEPTDGGFSNVGPSMQITGRTDGLNEKGLAMGYNFINTKQSADGFVCNMIGRIVLETCSTVEEAKWFLKEIPHRHSFSYVLIDKTGASIIVEASPRKVIFHHDKVCTNHFYKLTEENRYRMDDSLRRERLIKREQAVINKPFDAFQTLNDAKRGIFSTNYGAWSGTLHTVLYDTVNLSLWFSHGANRLPYIISFNEWLEGENLKVKRINGKLAAKVPFVHMINL